MITKRTLLLSILLLGLNRTLLASQADEVVITIDSQTAGATPFLSQLALSVSDTAAIRRIKFTIAPKPGSVTRPFAATYSQSYLAGRGDIVGGRIFLPVYGLYDGYSNGVTLTYSFNDGSARDEITHDHHRDLR